MRPFVFINSAMSADGKISTTLRKQVRISGENDLKRVDALRAHSDAVMVGIRTIIADDPKLTIKSKALKAMRTRLGKPSDPLRIVVDSNARTPLSASVLGARTLIAVSQKAPLNAVNALSEKAEVFVAGGHVVDLVALLSNLKQRGVDSLMVEGGARLNFALLDLGLVDEIYTYVGNIVIGGHKAPTLADGVGFTSHFVKLDLRELSRMDDGLLIKWRVKGRT
ncbi:MAG: 2,5-diamino-6-(ribosylamino)-4(3H)-pyrimidinone 5'-phosphate reductase [Halobacteriota archaeon]